MMSAKMSWSVVIIVTFIFTYTEACKGCNEITMKIKPQRKINNVIEFPTMYKAKLTPDCKLLPEGWMNVTQTINRNLCSYRIDRRGVDLHEENIDLCNMTTVEKVQKSLILFALPKECPIEQGLLVPSVDEGLDVTPWINYLRMGDGTKGNVCMDHGEVGKTCFNFRTSVKCDATE